MSPGSRPRPSLSEPAPSHARSDDQGVAGVSAPAFVERETEWHEFVVYFEVSPGSRPRPSLSDDTRAGRKGCRLVSPGSRPRPSLSEDLSRDSLRLSVVSPGSRPRPSLSGAVRGAYGDPVGGVAGVSSRMARMLGEVQDAIDERVDSVIVYRFKSGISKARIRFGRIDSHELGEPWVL